MDGEPGIAMDTLNLDELREIFKMTHSQREKRVLQGTLHYVKKNTEGNTPFTMNRHARERLEGMG